LILILLPPQLQEAQRLQHRGVTAFTNLLAPGALLSNGTLRTNRH